MDRFGASEFQLSQFRVVLESFNKTLSRKKYRVLKIYCVQNLHLWHRYHKYASTVVVVTVVMCTNVLQCLSTLQEWHSACKVYASK